MSVCQSVIITFITVHMYVIIYGSCASHGFLYAGFLYAGTCNTPLEVLHLV